RPRTTVSRRCSSSLRYGSRKPVSRTCVRSRGVFKSSIHCFRAGPCRIAGDDPAIAISLDVDMTSERQQHATWRDFYELGKPRVVLLIMFTAIAGMFLAAPGWPPLDALVFGSLGIALAASSAAAINHVLDRRFDAQMARTRNRPLPTGHV